jgi:hypothetical protein
VPAVFRAIPRRFGHLGVEADDLAQIMLVGDLAEIRENLGLLRIHPRPVGFRLEGQRIEVGGDVAGAAGILIVAPGAANVIAAFHQQHVVEAGLAQADRGGQAGKAGADD